MGNAACDQLITTGGGLLYTLSLLQHKVPLIGDNLAQTTPTHSFAPQNEPSSFISPASAFFMIYPLLLAAKEILPPHSLCPRAEVPITAHLKAELIDVWQCHEIIQSFA